MLLRLCIAICLYFVVSAGMAHAQTVSLRPRIEASGPAVTMGDVFEGVPSAIAGRALSPAPQPGQSARCKSQCFQPPLQRQVSTSRRRPACALCK